MTKEEGTNKKNGGIARAKVLTPERRKEIADKAIASRWDKSIAQVTHGSADTPLDISGISLPCYVLSNEMRVLSQTGLQTGIGMSRGGGKTKGAHRVADFIESLEKKGLKTDNLSLRIREPIVFKNNGVKVHGYEATVLADICDAVLAARREKILQPNQNHIAAQCELLVRGFARVGIIALIDEATGYQKDRAKDALAKILEGFIAKELQAYVRTFPADYYDNMFRLRGMTFPRDDVKRPQFFGKLTNDIIYRRLAPGVLEELKRVTPRDEKGRYKHRFFQRLTVNEGYRRLVEHIASVVTIMKLSDKWDDFMDKLDRIHSRYGNDLEMPTEDGNDKGKGL